MPPSRENNKKMKTPPRSSKIHVRDVSAWIVIKDRLLSDLFGWP